MKWVETYRIYKSRYAQSAFSGEGAKTYGGRWNHAGTAVVYCASSLALAQLETLVHLNGALPPVGFEYRTVSFPADCIGKRVTSAELQHHVFDWRRYPPHVVLQELGTDWIRSQQSLAMEVPSAVSPPDSNFLVNPNHYDFVKIVIGEPTPVEWDARLVERFRGG